MLANLLPGVREIRAPLASGYLWLAFLFVLFYDDIPQPGKATGLLQATYQVGAAAGPIATSVAFSFAAYLLGVLTTAVVSWLLGRRLPSPFEPSLLSGILYMGGPFRKIRHEVEDMAVEELAANLPLSERWRSLGNTEVELVKLFWREVESELSLAPARLVGEDVEVYNAWDRLDAEAEFRTAVSLPLAAIGGSLMFAEHAWTVGLLVLAGAVALSVNAGYRGFNAMLTMLQFIRAGKVDLATPERLLTRMLDRLERENPGGETTPVSNPTSSDQ